ncbi:unnamed protein product [Hermetia illucens]|uniref:Peptidase S1 domain-containing protein n=2 Tax=Hermetia illucens TaxID=343691 RepID=A0A7R8YSE1_HERIL|nr:unnamed protein product [Hermetia illucens]
MLNELKDNETYNLEGDGMENGGADEMEEGAEEMGEEEMVDEYVEKGYRKGNKKVIKTRAQQRCPTCQCGIRNARRIVGGRVTPKYVYPWAVVLKYGPRFFCGGSLVTDLHIVTAGHCTEGLSAAKMSAGFLQHDLRVPERGIAFMRKIQSYRRHANYNSQTLEHDIAILTLSRRVPIGSNLLRPICLPATGKSFVKKNGFIAGWGAVGEWSMPSAKLREAVVPIMSNKKCRKTAYGKDIKKSMMCAGYPKRGGIDACQGDSGGPLMVPENKRFYLAGVISWGDGCGARNHPGVYTRVPNYIKWIRNRTRNGCRCSS